MSSQQALQVRDALAQGYLATLLWDSWAHPETRTQATTWGLVLHVLYFGSSSDTARKLLHGPAFMMSHSVLVGWLQLTWFNPQIDLADKVCSLPCSHISLRRRGVCWLSPQHARLRAAGARVGLQPSDLRRPHARGPRCDCRRALDTAASGADGAAAPLCREGHSRAAAAHCGATGRAAPLLRTGLADAPACMLASRHLTKPSTSVLPHATRLCPRPHSSERSTSDRSCDRCRSERVCASAGVPLYHAHVWHHDCEQ